MWRCCMLPSSHHLDHPQLAVLHWRREIGVIVRTFTLVTAKRIRKLRGWTLMAIIYIYICDYDKVFQYVWWFDVIWVSFFLNLLQPIRIYSTFVKKINSFRNFCDWNVPETSATAEATSWSLPHGATVLEQVRWKPLVLVLRPLWINVSI